MDCYKFYETGSINIFTTIKHKHIKPNKNNGTVFNENTPLQGAAIYIGSSLIGTTSDKNGEFTLKVESGTYKLIISFLGYESQVYELNTLDYTEPLTFNLKEKKYDLDEITIYNKKREKGLFKIKVNVLTF
ncbi:carboxypeptidase-like regulatory domain-containing protein [Polaribacter ponticola]|uniref:carboxypeptidase-like regulatory domain-containing protein n=1 Tax=Polaribacter ponticola TaxID=2978475 RepID=UPI003B67F981